MAVDSGAIPAVNIAPIALEVDDADINEACFREVGADLVKAFTDIGFCYIKDHGVSKDLIQKCFDASKGFFGLPVEAKKQRLRPDGTADYFGWQPLPNTPGLDVKPEAFTNDRPPDFKETYNLNRSSPVSKFATDDEVPGFRATSEQYMDTMATLGRRILLALGYALNLEDPKGLLKAVEKLGTADNHTTLRYILYPPIPSDMRHENEMRCGEHTDFGFVTYLVDNGVSGLQVMTRSGKFLLAPTCEDAILLNICDGLERMTGGILRSAPHRVIVTDEVATKDRYTVIYFTVPDTDAYLDPLCGEKHRYQEKITFGEFCKRRMLDIFEAGQGVTKQTSD